MPPRIESGTAIAASTTTAAAGQADGPQLPATLRLLALDLRQPLLVLLRVARDPDQSAEDVGQTLAATLCAFEHHGGGFVCPDRVAVLLQRVVRGGEADQDAGVVGVVLECTRGDADHGLVSAALGAARDAGAGRLQSGLRVAVIEQCVHVLLVSLGVLLGELGRLLEGVDRAGAVVLCDQDTGDSAQAHGGLVAVSGLLVRLGELPPRFVGLRLQLRQAFEQGDGASGVAS